MSFWIKETTGDHRRLASTPDREVRWPLYYFNAYLQLKSGLGTGHIVVTACRSLPSCTETSVRVYGRRLVPKSVQQEVSARVLAVVLRCQLCFMTVKSGVAGSGEGALPISSPPAPS